MKLEQVNNVYMMGIGGIGMSALARFLHLEGKMVSGYDKTETDLTRKLIAEGIPVFYEADNSRLETADLIIYTPAIPKNFPERVEAEAGNKPFLKRAEVLGLISRSYRTIAVAGTHGKTTTSALVTHILRNSGVDATGFVGGIVNSFGSNFVHGTSDWVVIEADEFDRSFLHLSPEHAILTSVDADHLDIYGSGDHLHGAFSEFLGLLPDSGTAYVNDQLTDFAQGIGKNVVFYGWRKGTCRAENISFEGLKSRFDYVSPDHSIKGLELSLNGRYNVENAVAAISVALEIGADPEAIPQALHSFTGIWRRFEVWHQSERFIQIDDYAHHPEEIRALLSAVREMFPDWKLMAIFQPHLYSRTRDFAEGFSESLSLADEVVLLPIYPARELPIPGVESEMLLAGITCGKKRVQPWRVGDNANGFLADLEPGKVVLTVGAGDINRLVSPLTQLIESRALAVS